MGSARDDALLMLLATGTLALVMFLLTIGTFWGGVFVARRFSGGTSSYGLGAVGFRHPRTGYLWGAVIGVLSGVAATVLGMIATALGFATMLSLGYEPPPNPQEPLLEGIGGWASEGQTLALLMFALAIVVVGPLGEEILFRGGIFGGLYRLSERLFGVKRNSSEDPKTRPGFGWLSFGLSALLSSLLFALMHGAVVLLPATFVVGLCMCGLYKISGSLFVPFVGHATFNFITVMLVILAGAVGGAS